MNSNTYEGRLFWDRFLALLYRKQLWINLLAGLVAILVLLYARFVLVTGVDHDEVEHAHVGFRILNGQIPYRDFYQNHWPGYWLATTQFVKTFPYSVSAILAGRTLSMLALAGSWMLGLRLLMQIRGGQTWFARLVYTFAVILVAYMVEFHEARPDPVMALFGIASLCLIPARGLLGTGRALLLGVLFGISASLSTKILPIALVVPALIAAHCIRDRTVRPGIALFSYGFGVFLGLLPTALWIMSNRLFEAFYFDVWELNSAISKPWYDSFRFLEIPIYLASALGALVWLTVYIRPSNRDKNGPLVLALTLAAGLSLSAIIRHPGLYNLQILTIPIAIGFSNLVIVLWFRMRGSGFRLLLVAALLGYPATFIGRPLVRPRSSFEIPQHELQELMDLTRPSARTCTAFAPSHPIFCHDVSTLANHWDVFFVEQLTDPRQLRRFHRIWNDAIDKILEQPPDILLRDDPTHVWERAVAVGLITPDELEALDGLRPGYNVRHIGNREVWVRRSK